jgi:predicted O-methyltransferase YrrM
MLVRTLAGRDWKYNGHLSSEVEAGDFMYGLVRLLKPLVVVETGCYLGETSMRIGEALQANGVGQLHTCDIDTGMTSATRTATAGLPVTVHDCDYRVMAEKLDGVDLAYIDGSENRAAEAQAFRLSPHAYVVLHDANQPHYFDPLKTIWTAMRFPTPLGLALFEVKR